MARRIGMALEVWDRQPLGDQEDVIGRAKGTGAPLSGGTELTEPDLDMPGSGGSTVIAPDAHESRITTRTSAGKELMA